MTSLSCYARRIEALDNGVFVGEIRSCQERFDASISPKRRPLISQTVEDVQTLLVYWDIVQRRYSPAPRTTVRRFFPHLRGGSRRGYEMAVEGVTDAPSWAPSITMAHFSVGKEARGVTP